jgi:MazG family protein
VNDLSGRCRSWRGCAAPGGCPWDREQTFDTIKPYTLEEAYEVVEAIDARDWDELTGELGDLLLQVLFYSEMAAEEKRFSIDDVLDRLSNKLVDRHPHVFGDVKADTPGEVCGIGKRSRPKRRRSASRRREMTARRRKIILSRCSPACLRRCRR